MPTKLMCWLGDKGRQACPQKKKKPSKSGLFGKSNRLENAKVERPAKSGSLGMNNKIGLEHDMTNKAEMRQGHTRTTLTRHTNVKMEMWLTHKCKNVNVAHTQVGTLKPANAV